MGAHVKARRWGQQLAQVAGLVCVVVAVALLAGVLWGLLLAGLVLVAAGTLSEAGWI